MKNICGFQLQQDMLIKIINSYSDIHKTLHRLAIFSSYNIYTYLDGNITYSYDDRDYEFCNKRLMKIIEENLYESLLIM